MATNELFTRVNIGKMRLKNRIIMCPMGNKTDPDGGVQERNIDYFVEQGQRWLRLYFHGCIHVHGGVRDSRLQRDLQLFPCGAA